MPPDTDVGTNTVRPVWIVVGFWFKRLSVIIVLTALAILILGSEYFGSSGSPAWLRLVGIEIQAACRDAGTQWMVVVCLVVYFFTFTLLRHRVSGVRFWRWNNPDVWLCVLLLLAIARYAFSYGAASGDTQALVLMAGAAISQGVAAWVTWRDKQTEASLATSPRSPTISRGDLLRKTFVVTLLLLLSGAAMLRNEAGVEFRYRGTTRWSGPWNNPNTYGVMMGVGVILAVGLLARTVRHQFKAKAQSNQAANEVREYPPSNEVGRVTPCALGVEGAKQPTFNFQLSTFNAAHWFCITFYFCAAALCTYGLAKSYSRGAWLGTAVGLGFLLWRFLECDGMTSLWGMRHVAPGKDCAESRITHHAPRRNWLPTSVILASVLVLSFWQFRHTEKLIVRRAFSVGNINDFSWRNRVAAWEGSLAMMADRPFLGFGWSVPETMYDHAYRAANLEEGMAIQLNDFFTLGMVLGVPALLCFGGCLVFTFRGLVVESRACAQLSTNNFQLSTTAAAGALVLLVGFWFDGGLFKMSLATVFWVLLALVRREERGEEIKQDRLRQYLWGGVAIILALLTGMVWASAREPLRHEWFDVATPQRARTECSVVMPKHNGPFPVVIWSHGSGGNLMRSYRATRQIAELGMAAVCFEYDQTNQANFNAQMLAVIEFAHRQNWCRSNSTAWIGTSLGAQRQLSFMLTHRELVPRALVRLNGGWVDEMESLTNLARADLSARPAPTIPTRIWIVHGEQDEVFSAATVRQIETMLKEAGVDVRLSMFPGRGHVFGADQPLLATLAAEFIAEEFGTPARVTPNIRPRLLLLWLPLLFAVCLLVCLRFGRSLSESWRQSSKLVRAASILFALVATGLTAIQFLLPPCQASPLVLRVAKQTIVKQNLDADFAWLAEQPGCDRIRIKELLAHVELAAMQRDSFGSKLDENVFQKFVLSPQIDSAFDGDMSWRRPLWEYFYRRVRKENSHEAAAEIIVRHLRERITITETADSPKTIAEIWQQQVAMKSGFERIYVAALRSAGIPARLSVSGQAEFWTGTEWKPAPRPLDVNGAGRVDITPPSAPRSSAL